METCIGCDPRGIGGGGYVNCRKSVLGVVEEEGRRVSWVSLIFLLRVDWEVYVSIHDRAAHVLVDRLIAWSIGERSSLSICQVIKL